MPELAEAAASFPPETQTMPAWMIGYLRGRISNKSFKEKVPLLIVSQGLFGPESALSEK
jgi:hypothetical protein